MFISVYGFSYIHDHHQRIIIIVCTFVHCTTQIIFEQTLRGYKFMAKCGFVHGDTSLENVLVNNWW